MKVRNPPCRSDYRTGDELLDGSPWAVEDDAAEEAAVVAVQTRIARMSDSELGELALHASPLTASVELATFAQYVDHGSRARKAGAQRSGGPINQRRGGGVNGELL